MAYFDGAADLEHLRDSGFVECFLKVLKKLRLLVNNRHTYRQSDRYERGLTALRSTGETVCLFGLRAATLSPRNLALSVALAMVMRNLLGLTLTC